MSTIPILLKTPKILVLGGGAVALQKATVLYRNNIKFSMVSKCYCSEFNQLNVEKVVKDIELNDFDKYNIVVDATGCEEVGQLLQVVTQKRFMLVNRVDQPDQCNFYFSSLLRYGSLKVAVSTDGASPTISKIIRDKIDAFLPNGLANLVEETKRQRQEGLINPDLARNRLLTLFSHVYLIECNDVAENLTTIIKYPHLSRFSVVLYQADDQHPDLNNDSHDDEIEYVAINSQNDCFNCDKAYGLLKSYCQNGEAIGVLIRSSEHFLQQSEKLNGYLKNDGVTTEIIVKQ